MKLETSKRPCGLLGAAAMASLGLVLFSGQTPVWAANPMPQIVTTNGRHAFMVDGAPFLMLGAQCHNSSAWPATLSKVWAAIDDLHANTLDFGAWSAIINFRPSGRRPGGFGGGPGVAAANPAATNNAAGAVPDAGKAAPPAPTGRALVAQIKENQFYITGSSCTIEFRAASGGQRDWLRVEEAEQLERKPNASHHGRDYSPASAFRVGRILNGDETDHALPFGTAPQTLRITLGTY